MPTQQPCPLPFSRYPFDLPAIMVVPACAVLILGVWLFPDEVVAERPHIVTIFTDDQGYHDVGCYGSEIPTPHTDRLADEGLRFTQFYAASSICTPSRYGLLTGRYAHRSHDELTGALMFLAETDSRRGIRPDEETYVSRLRDAGYRTALVGKWHLGHGDPMFWPTNHGFDSFFGHTGGCVDFFTLRYANQPDWYRGRELVEPQGYATDVITREAVDVIRRTADSDQPLHLLVSYNAPHFGKGWNEERQTPENVMQPKPEDLRRVTEIRDPLRRAFAAKVVGMDESIGQLLDAIQEAGIAEETLLIFMTDHGGAGDYGGSNLPFRGGKATLFEGGIRVPCIVRWPGKIRPGVSTDAVAAATDWFPTLLDILGDPTPTRRADGQIVDGQSILPILLGKSAGEPRELVWRTGSHAELGRESWAAARVGDWKWVRPPDSDGMLFDLRQDPQEKHDRSQSDPEIASQLAALATE